MNTQTQQLIHELVEFIDHLTNLIEASNCSSLLTEDLAIEGGELLERVGAALARD